MSAVLLDIDGALRITSRLVHFPATDGSREFWSLHLVVDLPGDKSVELRIRADDPAKLHVPAPAQETAT